MVGFADLDSLVAGTGAGLLGDGVFLYNNRIDEPFPCTVIYSQSVERVDVGTSMLVKQDEMELLRSEINRPKQGDIIIGQGAYAGQSFKILCTAHMDGSTVTVVVRDDNG